MKKQNKPANVKKPDGKLKRYFKEMKTVTKVDYATYLGVILAFVIVMVCQSQGLLNRSMSGMLVPICAYVCMGGEPEPHRGYSGRAEPWPCGVHERRRVFRHYYRHEPPVRDSQ